MIATETLDRVIGQDVYDESGDKIGSASEVYLDDETGLPEWVTVKTGLFGTKESFVPIRDADLTGDGLRVHALKAKVKDAPKIDADGHLSPQEERELYRYYGIGWTETDRAGMATTTTTTTTGPDVMAGEPVAAEPMAAEPMAAEPMAAETMPRGTAGRDSDDAMTRSEERLDVGTRAEETGRARLRKYVVTENVTRTVPVSHEEVRVEREPVTDANRDRAMAGPDISEAEHEVTLHAERPVVSKETEPVERVRLGTETVRDEAQVSEPVRKEEIDVDAPSERDRRG